MLFMEERRGRLGLLLLPFFLAGDPGERERLVPVKNRSRRRPPNLRETEEGGPRSACGLSHVARGSRRAWGGPHVDVGILLGRGSAGGLDGFSKVT